MTTLHEELYLLFLRNDALRSAAKLSKLTTQESLARTLCDHAKRRSPQTDCDFWNRFRGLDVWEIAYFGTAAQKWAAADWLREERKKRQEIAAAKDTSNWQPE